MPWSPLNQDSAQASKRHTSDIKHFPSESAPADLSIPSTSHLPPEAQHPGDKVNSWYTPTWLCKFWSKIYQSDKNPGLFNIWKPFLLEIDDFRMMIFHVFPMKIAWFSSSRHIFPMFRQVRHLRWSLSMSQQRQQDGNQSGSQNPGLGGCDKTMVPKNNTLWSFSSWIFPWKMVDLSIVMLNYQRVTGSWKNHS